MEVRAIPKLRLGTRGSRLALAQAHALRDDLNRIHPSLEVEIVTIKTSGDRGDRDRLGAFVREIQESLLANNVDVALHCLKDLPTEPVPGLLLAVHLEREDPRDTIITRGPTLADLPQGSVIGTGSLRRTSQLASQRPDLTFRPLVGNVDTRLRKLQEGEYDAIVLAIAGLKRLGILRTPSSSRSEGERRDASSSLTIEGFDNLIVRPLQPAEMLPAPGQAVLVLETRQGDDATIAAIASMNHEATKRCSAAERAFLRTFGGGCSVPVAALATADGDTIHLTGLTASPDGKRVVTGQATGTNATQLGTALANELGQKGAFEIVKEVASLRQGSRGSGGTDH